MNIYFRSGYFMKDLATQSNLVFYVCLRKEKIGGSPPRQQL